MPCALLRRALACLALVVLPSSPIDAQELPRSYPYKTLGLDTISGPLGLSFFRIAGRSSPTLACAPATGSELVEVRNRGELLYVSCIDLAGRIPRWTAHRLFPLDFARDLGRPTMEPWLHYPAARDGAPDPLGSGTVIPGLDRGHLVPRSDFSAVDLAARATFNVLNRAPQASTFNQYGWRCAEILVRAFARDKGLTLLVVTGTSGTMGSVTEDHGQPLRRPADFWKVAYDPYTATHFTLFGSNVSNTVRPLPRCVGTGGPVFSSIRAAVPLGLECNLSGRSLLADFQHWLLGPTWKGPPTDVGLQQAMAVRCVNSELVCPGAVTHPVYLERGNTRGGPLYFRVPKEARLCSANCRVSPPAGSASFTLRSDLGSMPPAGDLNRAGVETAFGSAADGCLPSHGTQRSFGTCMGKIESYFVSRGGTEPAFAARLNRGKADYLGTIDMVCSEP